MKEIKLKQLKMSNWRGQNHDITFNDGATRISGVNSAGKSSVMHAFFWCISGFTDSHTPKNHNLFDNRCALDENTPWASVEVVLEVDDIKYELQRRSKPKFTRSKGSMTFSKSPSDSYEYYVDSIEVGATGFNNFVENTLGIPLSVITFALSGDFFSSLVENDKNDSRKVLCDIAGEVKPEHFKGDYSSIKDLLERYTASEIVEMSKKKKKPLEERQNIIPLEIDRKEERLSELRAMDFTYTESEIERVKKEIETIDGLLLGNADALKPILDANREIENKVANKRLSLVNGRLDYKEVQNARTSEIKAKIAEVKRYNEGIEKENAKIKREFEEMDENAIAWSKKLSVLEEKRIELLKRRDEVKGRVFAEETCAYCGQELPYELQEKARDKFNETKTKDLELVVKEGKQVAEEIAKAKEKTEELGKKIEEGYTLLEKQDITSYEEELAKIEASFVPYEETDEFKRINAEIEALLSEMKEIPSNDNEVLTSKKKGLIEELSELSKKLGLKDEIGKVEKEVSELREELRSVACSIAELEKSIYIAKQWEQERNDIVSDRINGKMKKARFEMWSTQKNGELVPDLVLTNEKGVKFSSTNFANRIEIQLDLQELFCTTFDVNLPRFIDESAVFSPSNLPKLPDSQVIYLFASDSPYLCVE